MSEEPLTLAELQTAKDTLETRAHRLREVLHELRRTQPGGWQVEFERVQGELIEVAGRIGRLDKQIRKLVEGAGGPVEEDDTDV